MIRLLDSRGIPFARPSLNGQAHAVRARYDSALHTDESRKHWSLVDSMSAKAANSLEVRRNLRIRARYETSNNSYAAGMVSTLSNDTVGTGPRLQMLTPNQDLNSAIEKSFMLWRDQVRLSDKLRTMRRSLAVDGEAFGMFTTNSRVDFPVQLDLKLIEADQISTPYLNPIDPQMVDGIRFDRDGNPIEYDVLKHHPGDTYQIGLVADKIDARRMVHWFRCDRPGQVRGIPEITPALPLYALLRRYTLAVLGAAETAADLAAVLYAELPPDGEFVEGKPFETLDIERRLMMTLPTGYRLEQFKAEQPTTAYEMFKHEIINEIARCLNMPYNVAAGNSSNYNYASGRLDHQVYHKSIEIDQFQLEQVVLNPILAEWITEASLVTDIPDDMVWPAAWPHQWFWDGWEHVDPQKEASAQQIRLQNNTTTLADEYARRGQDWETQLRQRGKEIALAKELGLPMPPTPGAAPGSTPGSAPSGEMPPQDGQSGND